MAFKQIMMPYSALCSIAFAGVLIVFLFLDTNFFPGSLFLLSPSRRLILARLVDSELDAAISRAEEYLVNLEPEEQEIEVENLSKEFRSDFAIRSPFPKIAEVLLKRTIVNFLLTIFCFSILTMALAILDQYQSSAQKTYGHSCLELGSFPKIMLHFFYYHMVVFQSLGDGNHAPQTLVAQLIATVEALVAFMYIIFTFGRVVSIPLLTLNEITPEKLESDLYDRFMMLCSPGNPITQGMIQNNAAPNNSFNRSAG